MMRAVSWQHAAFWYHMVWFMLKGRMSVSFSISCVGFPSSCQLGIRSVPEWTKQLDIKADHFHIVLRLRIHGTFHHCNCYYSWHCDLVVLFLSKVNCGEKVKSLVFLLIIMFWRILSTKLLDITCHKSLADIVVTVVITWMVQTSFP